MDDAVLLETISAMLEVAGHQVTRARDGVEARSALTSETISLVVTDLHSIEAIRAFCGAESPPRRPLRRSAP